MIQEDKDLLLKDLCARLPYGVKCEVIKRDVDGEMLFIRRDLELTVNNIKEIVTNNMYEIKPNLFPISSMTEEQKEDMIKSSVGIGSDKNVFDWYNKNHFDYRGLIPLGLANNATRLNIY